MSVQESLVSAIGSLRGASAADRICATCVDLFAVDEVAISLVFGGVDTGTLGVSGDQARTLDELQFTLGEGPCLDSVTARAPVLVNDLDDLDRARWRAYGPAMLAHDIRAVFAIPVLVAGEYIGALDLFCRSSGPLSTEDLSGALVAAELAELPLLDLLGENLQRAANDPDSFEWSELDTLTRSEVNQATGMLMAQLEVDPTEALVRLRAHAYATGRSARDVARDILDRRLRLDTD